MPVANWEKLSVTPDFDMELLLSNSQESRLDGILMDKLMDYWERWLPRLNARRLTIGKDAYLAVWLEEAVEEAVDAVWERSPSEAFTINALAQTMCMSAVYSLVPEVEEAGCAPAPRPTLDLKNALEEAGLRDDLSEDPGLGLARRYAVATYYPFRSGCEICALRGECPKLMGRGGDYSVKLPGHMR